MPLLIPLALILVALLAAIALLPLTVVQRYRVGTARRPARGWLAAVNLAGVAVSVAMFLAGAAVTAVWVPGALTSALAGLGAGCALGVLGLALTRWEDTARGVYYTPNRLLVLAITVVVSARLIYGLWRTWHSWRAAIDGAGWISASGVAGSLAAGAVVLGYYLVYWAGVRRRYVRWQRRRWSGGA